MSAYWQRPLRRWNRLTAMNQTRTILVAGLPIARW
jgi:hypothetical protein